MKKILIYSDNGVGVRSLCFLIKSLRDKEIIDHCSVKTIRREDILSTSWEDEASLLIFPGGRDSCYHYDLQGEGNFRIRNYVERGGSYLGICAGAYYGCSSIEFEKGHPLEVIAKRELGFFPGKAIGPAYGPNKFRYGSDVGSQIAQILWKNNADSMSTNVYYNGGCTFVNANKRNNTTILARYEELSGMPPAIIHCSVKHGNAILCGVHPEYLVKPSIVNIARKQLFSYIIGLLIYTHRE